jgi:hypothetical protein
MENDVYNFGPLDYTEGLLQIREYIPQKARWIECSPLLSVQAFKRGGKRIVLPGTSGQGLQSKSEVGNPKTANGKISTNQPLFLQI